MDDDLAFELCKLSEAVYAPDNAPDDWNPSVDGWGLFGAPSVGTLSGFYAATFQRTRDGAAHQYVITFRGTDSSSKVAAGLDLVADWALIAAPNWAFQFAQAIAYAGEVRQKVLASDPDAQIMVTGHSLGGSLAQIAAAMFSLGGAAFDPGGAENAVNSVSFSAAALIRSDDSPTHEPGDDFWNYVVSYSPISHLSGKHVGKHAAVEISKDALVATYLNEIATKVADYGSRGVVAAQVSFIKWLHGIDGISAYFEERAGADQSGRLDAKVQQIASYAKNGDFGVDSSAGSFALGTIESPSSTGEMTGNNADDVLIGGRNDDVVFSLAGSDTVFGGDGDDFVSTAQGNDIVDGGLGNDMIFAGSGDDVVNQIGGPLAHTDVIDGGNGDDVLNVDFSALNTRASYEIVDADGAEITLSHSSSFAAIHDALATANSFVLASDLAGTGTRIEFANIEHVNLVLGSSSGLGLSIFQNGMSYRGGTSHSDTFFADWSSATESITWINDPSRTQNVNGVSISGFERLLVAAGSGNDVIINPASAYLPNDEIYTGAGNDTINAGPGDDIVVAGSGDDTIDQIYADSSFVDILDGGGGNDVLNIDYTGLNTRATYDAIDPSGKSTRLDWSTSFANARDALEQAESFVVASDLGGGTRTVFSNIEHVNLALGADAGLGLAIFQGGTSYKGGAGYSDTFFADWSSATEPITWINDPSKTQNVNGVSISGFERLLLATGGGNDVVINTGSAYLPNDEIYTGAGNDTINAGLGDDIVVAGSGVDTMVVLATRAQATLIRAADGWKLNTPGEGADELVSVERVSFADATCALDVDSAAGAGQGSAGMTAKILGAVFGRDSVMNKQYVGIGLYYLDTGMGFATLMDLAISARLGGAVTPQSVVQVLWTNIVGSPPTTDQAAPFEEILESGMSIADLGLLAANTSLNLANISLVGLSQQGLDFVPYAPA